MYAPTHKQKILLWLSSICLTYLSYISWNVNVMYCTVYNILFHWSIPFRLTPSYMILLAILVYLYRYLGNGPHWPETIDVAEQCRTNWWHHLLHINNLVDIDGKDAIHQVFFLFQYCPSTSTAKMPHIRFFVLFQYCLKFFYH